MIADLHCHSHISDGSLTIPDLVGYAKRIGIKALAVADHDTVAGHAAAASACRECGIVFIPAIEISAYDYRRDRKAHLLGYLLDRPGIAGEACREILRQREKQSRRIVELLRQSGYALDWETVRKIAADSTNVYKQHIMHALMELGYAAAVKGELYQKLFGKSGLGQPGEIVVKDIDYMDVFEALRLIQEAGGVAVLAHPAGYRNLELIPELAAAGLDGLEAWHPLHNAADTAQIKELAAAYGLLLTGGSDFHGMYEGKPNPLGSRRTPGEWLERLYERKNNPD
jgi:predicted metal-dependent phosphoesterase TrpH